MEIILLVIASFGPAGFQSIEIHNYAESFQGDQTCETFLRSAEFKKQLRQRARKGIRFRAQCMGASQLAGFEQIASQASAWTEIASAEPVLLQGKIVYDESVSSRKSVDAYLGNDLTITTREGRFALYSSESVGVQKLRSLHGKTVKLRAVLEDTTPAKDSMGQYPAEMDGSPMKRTGYRIISIEK